MTQRGKARNRTGVRPSPGVATAGHRIAFGCFHPDYSVRFGPEFAVRRATAKSSDFPAVLLLDL